MDRVIKFRFFSKEGNTIDKNECWKRHDWGRMIKPPCDMGFLLKETDRWKPCQFTGVKDKNGKEIYEGDIVQHTFVDDDEKEVGTSEVQYREFDVGFVLVNDNLIQQWWQDDDLWEIEVIGNIYENPDLRKLCDRIN